MSSQSRTRLQIKAQMVADRKDRSGYCKCDLCDNVGTDMHEIISRNRTIKNPAVREMTYCEELCSILCANCHAKAPSKPLQTRLLAINIAIYGLDRVKTAFDAIPPQYRMRIKFPEEL